MVRVLGISSSLRNARFGAGSQKLIEEIQGIEDKEGLSTFLDKESHLRLEDILSAGREKKLPFNEIYQNLQENRGERGLSNSEGALAAGLWGAHQAGAEITHCGLSRHFPMDGSVRNPDALRELILGSDGILVSGPVYFGDRSSVAQAFIEFLLKDDACREHIRNKVYGGIAVGAKRNGGQETTLIYQMVDMANLGMLTVGNDSETTSQYGGTAVAGDVGTIASDIYGINTAIGTGRRVAQVSKMLLSGEKNELKDNVKIAIWLLQDKPEQNGLRILKKLCREVESQCDSVTFHIRDFTNEKVYRCIACDICPVCSGPSEKYRCVITSDDDAFKQHHEELIQADAIILAGYSPIKRDDIKSIYQTFVERTRYLRRDDYVLGDRLSAPLVISEINSNQNLHIRMMTSLVRHHHVLNHPLIGMEHQGEILNWDNLVKNTISFAKNAARLATGRISLGQSHAKNSRYHPVGYSISAEKAEIDARDGTEHHTDQLRQMALSAEQKKRIR